jgi:Cysteine-rich secretory protein family
MEHDLFGKPASTLGSSPRASFFRIMLCRMAALVRFRDIASPNGGKPALHGSVMIFAELSRRVTGGFRLVDFDGGLLRPSALTVIAGFVLMLGITGCADNAPPPGQPSFYIDLSKPGGELDANAAQSMISGYRGNNGLGPVTLDPELMRLASDQAQAMAARDKLDHSANRPFQDRIRSSGFDAAVAVENIGAGYHTLAEAFSGWRDSPPHRANMLNANVTRMGIAAVYTPKSKYKVYWSLILAKPDERRG